MIHRIKAHYYALKLRQKATFLYLLWGILITIPLAVISGLFLYSYLLREEKDTLSNSLAQAASQIESELSVYTALSDYIFNDSDLIAALNQTYTDNYYDMYEALENTLIPDFRAYQFLNPHISSIKIFTDSGLPNYKSYVRTLDKLSAQSWFDEVKNHYQPVWLISKEDSGNVMMLRKLLCNWTYTKNNYLCIEIDSDTFFSSLAALDSNGTDWDFFIPDQSDTQSTHSHAGYICTQATLSIGWQIFYCRSLSSFYVTSRPILIILWLVIILLVTTLLFCTYLISDTLIRPIEKLSRKVLAVTASGSHSPLYTRRTDEIGKLTQHFNQMIQEVYQNKLLISEYRLKSLYAQINPHFLYNALGLINNKAIIADQDDISRMALLLSQFYRTCLNHGKEITTIGNELKNIELYLEIQKIMYHGDFHVEWQLDQSLYEIEMPNFILQPVIENAIEHGLRNAKKEEKNLLIRLGCPQDTNKEILFVIKDNGVGMTADELSRVSTHETDGVGLFNIDQRLKLFYGPEYGLSIESEKNLGTTVTIRIYDKQSS